MTTNTATASQQTADAIRAAMLETLRDVAQDASLSLEDAALLAVSLGAAFADLCRLLDIDAPAPVAAALG